MVGNNPISFLDETGGTLGRFEDHSAINLGSPPLSPANSITSGQVDNYEPLIERLTNELYPSPSPTPAPIHRYGTFRRALIWGLDSAVGVNLFPPGTTITVSSIAIGAVFNNLSLLAVAYLHPNPGWSTANTWDGLNTPGNATFAETQERNLAHNSITLGTASMGSIIGSIIGSAASSLAERIRDTATKKAEKADLDKRLAEAEAPLNLIQEDSYHFRKPYSSSSLADWTYLVNETLKVRDRLGSNNEKVLTILADIRSHLVEIQSTSNAPTPTASPTPSSRSSFSSTSQSRIPRRVGSTQSSRSFQSANSSFSSGSGIQLRVMSSSPRSSRV
jgi:hypothetical protein